MSEQLSTLPTFEQQFENVHTVDSWGGETTYVHIKPEHPVSEHPVLMASGWSEGRHAFKDSAKEVYNSGREAILVDHARRGGAGHDSRPSHSIFTEFHGEVLHKANSLLEVIEASGIDKVNVIAHSEGAINTVVAALQRPQKFNTIILAMPAGMVGKDSLSKLMGRFAPKLIRSMTKDMGENPETAKDINFGGVKYVARNPAKAIREARSMAETSIDDVLELLITDGINIGVLQSNADSIYPAHRIETNVRLEGGFANVDAYASVAAKDAGHDDLLIHPERATNAALQMIAQFE